MRTYMSSVVLVAVALTAVHAGFHPRQYICYRAAEPITIDGKLNEPSWLRAPCTELFGNMQAPPEPPPYYATRAKMLWDDEYMYFGVAMEDPNVWGSINTRDGPIYDNNDIEIFMDIDSDGWWYYEFEMNCLNVVYDVLIKRRGAGLGIEWDIEGIRTAVHIDGTLNYAEDTDRGWTAEIAWPMASLAEYAGSMPIPPHSGDEWRVDFVRVYLAEDDGSKSFQMKPGTDKDLWMWSPHRYVRMHYPQSWGIVRFSEQEVGTQDCTRDQLSLQPAFLTPVAKPGAEESQPGSMVYMPAGECQIGPNPLAGPESEAARAYVDAFYIDRYEVTVGQYASFLNAVRDTTRYHPHMAHEGCGIVEQPDGTYRVRPGRELYPMVFVVQQDAEAFAAWDGKRLPTHEEWERACRFDDGRAHPWGEATLSPLRANYDYHYGGTVPVGSFPDGVTANSVHDMAGNVWEMCAGTRAIGERDLQTTRGGGWVSPSPHVHAAVDVAGVTRCQYIGFRCARDAE